MVISVNSLLNDKLWVYATNYNTYVRGNIIIFNYACERNRTTRRCCYWLCKCVYIFVKAFWEIYRYETVLNNVNVSSGRVLLFVSHPTQYFVSFRINWHNQSLGIIRAKMLCHIRRNICILLSLLLCGWCCSFSVVSVPHCGACCIAIVTYRYSLWSSGQSYLSAAILLMQHAMVHKR